MRVCERVSVCMCVYMCIHVCVCVCVCATGMRECMDNWMS